MRIHNAIILILLAYAGYLTIERSIPVFPTSGCAPISSGFNLKWFGMQSSSSDPNCTYLEAARTDPVKDRATLMRCSTPASIAVFGGVRHCVAYNGDNESVIARVEDQLAVCRKRSRKARYRLTFRVKKKFSKCMSAL